jgi:hypothetical protein
VTGATPDATTSNGGTAAASTPPASLSQDAAVSISPEGAAALAEDPGSMTASSTTTQTRTTPNDIRTGTDTADADNTDDTDSAGQSSSVNDAGSDASAASAATSVSPLKSFAYGTLGLERPDQTQQETNSFYTAGRWLAAGITIGGLISLFA